tara:strand:+ start:581 stop:772 length:192 start_codon:yes stop_codon:yes gene_type:complete
LKPLRCNCERELVFLTKLLIFDVVMVGHHAMLATILDMEFVWIQSFQKKKDLSNILWRKIPLY